MTGSAASVTIASSGNTTVGTVGDVSGISAVVGSVSVTAHAVTIDAPIKITSSGSATITANGPLDGNVGVFADIDVAGFTTLTASGSISGTGTIRGGFVTLSAAAGIGTDATGFVTTEAGFLTVDNTTTNNVAVVNASDVILHNVFRNQAPSGALSLRVLNGPVSTVDAIVSTNNGAITVTADNIGEEWSFRTSRSAAAMSRRAVGISGCSRPITSHSPAM